MAFGASRERAAISEQAATCHVIRWRDTRVLRSSASTRDPDDHTRIAMIGKVTERHKEVTNEAF